MDPDEVYAGLRLDSVAYGEAQVLGQVREALLHSSNEDVAGRDLKRLFPWALARPESFARWARSRQSAPVLSVVRRRILAVAQDEVEPGGRGETHQERAELSRFARSPARTPRYPGARIAPSSCGLG